MSRFFVAKEQIQGDAIWMIGSDVHHLRDVLRKTPGDIITVLDGENRQYSVRIDRLTANTMEGTVTDSGLRDTEPGVSLTLAQALPKGEKMEWILQKCTEIGFSRFIPVISERSVVRLEAERAAKKALRWQRVVQEAAEQAGRAVLPQVAPVCDWQGLLERFGEYGLVLVPWESEETSGVRSVIQNRSSGEILVVIGPEGGFSAREIELARSRGAQPVSLGRRILRTETAGLVAGAIILYESGDLG